MFGKKGSSCLLLAFPQVNATVKLFLHMLWIRYANYFIHETASGGGLLTRRIKGLFQYTRNSLLASGERNFLLHGRRHQHALLIRNLKINRLIEFPFRDTHRVFFEEQRDVDVELAAREFLL